MPEFLDRIFGVLVWGLLAVGFVLLIILKVCARYYPANYLRMRSLFFNIMIIVYVVFAIIYGIIWILQGHL
jgi:hypothetical protein